MKEERTNSLFGEFSRWGVSGEVSKGRVGVFFKQKEVVTWQTPAMKRNETDYFSYDS